MNGARGGDGDRSKIRKGEGRKERVCGLSERKKTTMGAEWSQKDEKESLKTL